MTDDPHSKLRQLSDRLVAAQRPIRVLEATQWPADVESRFLAARGRELPNVSVDSYRPLRFDPNFVLAELRAIASDARRVGGPAAELLGHRCDDYRRAVRLLIARGTLEFSALSMTAYGRPTASEDQRIRKTLAALEHHVPPEPNALATVSAAQAVEEFRQRLVRSLPIIRPQVKLSDAIVADATAGCSYVKLRTGATFSQADLDLLLVHEGWVHLGTTLNGHRQPYCAFLAKGPPGTSPTQEGLAILCELLAGVSHAGRIRRIVRRYDAVHAAMNGADFRDVYRTFLDATGNERASYQCAARVFRGCPPSRGPFAKDFGYALGLVRVLAAVQDHRNPANLAILFAGKATLADYPRLVAGLADGTVARPAFLPPPIAKADLAHRLAAIPHVGHNRRAPYGFGETRSAALEPTNSTSISSLLEIPTAQ